jgi:hypothetical protein
LPRRIPLIVGELIEQSTSSVELPEKVGLFVVGAVLTNIGA